MKNILWTYDHPAARNQEMLLFQTDESAVVPLLDKSIKWESYHDESHPSYPVWQINVNIPLDELYEVRQNFSVHPSERVKFLINKHFDFIFINTDPDGLDHLLSWYKGKILFRLNGGPNSKHLIGTLNGWRKVIKERKAFNNFIYLPSHNHLFVNEFNDMGIKTHILPVFVDEKRIDIHYKQEKTFNNTVSVAISYYEDHPFFAEHFNKLIRLSEEFSHVTFNVHGKNRRSYSSQNVNVYSNLPFNEYWKSIMSARFFLDIGENQFHTIFPPFEVMKMGMPTLFTKRNGHYFTMEKYFKEAPEEYGFFEDHVSAVNFGLNATDEELMLLNKKQLVFIEQFMCYAIAREAALASIDSIESISKGDILKIECNLEGFSNYASKFKNMFNALGFKAILYYFRKKYRVEIRHVSEDQIIYEGSSVKINYRGFLISGELEKIENGHYVMYLNVVQFCKINLKKVFE